MDTFTITLLGYDDYSLSFDYTSFIEKFPDSLITRALDLSHEKDIPIDNPIVTPEVLQVLSQIITTGTYPYTPIEYERALDYLNIDLPNPIYNPKYRDVLTSYPNINLDNLDSPNYSILLNVALEFQFQELAEYIFAHTNPNEHQQEDYTLFQTVLNSQLTPILTQIGVMILENRNILSLLQGETLESGPGWYQKPRSLISILKIPSPDLLKAYVKLNPFVIREYGIISTILDEIIEYPENYIKYAKMLFEIDQYTSRIGAEGNLINLFMASYHGDPHILRYLSRSEDNIIYLGPVVAYTALITRHYETAQFIINRFFTYLREVGEASDITGIDEWFTTLTKLYISHPQWMTQEGRQLLRDNYRHLSEGSQEENLDALELMPMEYDNAELVSLEQYIS